MTTEELQDTARLFLFTEKKQVSYLNEVQVAELRQRFPV